MRHVLAAGGLEEARHHDPEGVRDTELGGIAHEEPPASHLGEVAVLRYVPSE